MRFSKITDINHPLFAKAWELYLRSFPPQERRQLRTQRKIMGNPLYHFELVTDGDLFVGFLLWWSFDDVRYIEHLATTPQLRGGGYGARILGDFILQSDVSVLLEVEHPTDEMSRRRIGFYDRAGFILNDRPYTHPPYKKGGKPVSLMLMTYPTAITNESLNRFLGEHHPVIHEFVMK